MDAARLAHSITAAASGILLMSGPIAAAFVEPADEHPRLAKAASDTVREPAPLPAVIGADLPRRSSANRVVTAAASAEARAPERGHVQRIVLWGDSLAWEAADAFRLGVRAAGAVPETRTFGGTAPCDWLDEISTRAGRPLDAAILEFAGNALTSCMRAAGGEPLTGSALIDRYRADLTAAITALQRRGLRIYIVGPPPPRSEIEPGRHASLIDLYQSLADPANRVWFLDAGTAVLDNGAYADSLPCAPWEGEGHGCDSGYIRVRAEDGLHFCPAADAAEAGVVTRCSVWSSGAFRFGMAMAAPVVVRSEE